MVHNRTMTKTENGDYVVKANDIQARSDPIWGQIQLGDALDMAASLPAGCLDVVYIDPPYFTKRNYVGKSRVADSTEILAFADRWQGGKHEYLEWLRVRLTAIHRLLAPTGCLLLHLDWHAVHYARVLCDGIFGDDNFQNELIWYYQTGGASKGRFSRKHDNILLYSRGPEFHFNGAAIAMPRTAKSMKRARSGRGARIAADDTHKNPDDVLMVPALNPMAKERTGYPTQKPVELLEKLLLALCPPGGAVGDFFCGSGTTLVAAEQLGLRWVGCDVSAEAVALAKRRVGSECRSLHVAP